MNIEGKLAGDIAYAEGWLFTRVTLKTGDGKALSLHNASNMQLPSN
jgi:hypothetical protein